MKKTMKAIDVNILRILAAYGTEINLNENNNITYAQLFGPCTVKNDTYSTSYSSDFCPGVCIFLWDSEIEDMCTEDENYLIEEASATVRPETGGTVYIFQLKPCLV